MRVIGATVFRIMVLSLTLTACSRSSLPSGAREAIIQNTVQQCEIRQMAESGQPRERVVRYCRCIGDRYDDKVSDSDLEAMVRLNSGRGTPADQSRVAAMQTRVRAAQRNDCRP